MARLFPEGAESLRSAQHAEEGSLARSLAGLGHGEEDILDQANRTEEDPRWGSFGLGYHPLSREITPVLGIRYFPSTKSELEQSSLELARAINGVPRELGSFSSWLKLEISGLSIFLLTLPEIAARGAHDFLERNGDSLRREVNRYLYPPTGWLPGGAELEALSIEELKSELKGLGVQRLPRLKSDLTSLLYQKKVDPNLRRPQAIERLNYLGFITEDSLLLEALSLLFEKSYLGPSIWSGRDRSLLIYDPLDLSQESADFAEKMRQDVADDLRDRADLIRRLQEKGSIYSLEAVPVFPSRLTAHPYSYRISYRPSVRPNGYSSPILSILSLEELEALANGKTPVGDGVALEPKLIDFSQNLL